MGQWLNSNGITAFVLRYRTAYVPAFITHYRLVFRGNRYPDALNDLRQTLRLIRRDAASYGIDTTMIGVMGFSAGGHLAMCSAELLPRREWPAFIAHIPGGDDVSSLRAQALTPRTPWRQPGAQP